MPRVHDEALPTQVGHSHPAAARQPVSFRQGDDVLLLPQRGHGDVGALGEVCEGTEQGEVDRPVAERTELLGAQHLAAEGEVHSRQLLAQGPGQGGQQGVGRRSDAPEDEAPLEPVPDPESNDALHELLAGLPLFPYMDIAVTPLAVHPSDVNA